jgi:hypothetical protein
MIFNAVFFGSRLEQLATTFESLLPPAAEPEYGIMSADEAAAPETARIGRELAASTPQEL